MSKLFGAKPQKAMGVVKGQCLESKSGSSGETLDGILQYISLHSPNIVVLENVEELFWNTGSKHEYLFQALKQRGYACSACEMVSTKYACPQRRKRAYLIAYRVLDGMDWDAVKRLADSAVALATSFSLPEASIESFLLSPDDPYVKDELARRLATREAADAGLLEQEMEEWKDKNRIVLERQGLSCSQCVPPASVRSSDWYGVLTPRQRMVMGHAYLTVPGLRFADVHQLSLIHI